MNMSDSVRLSHETADSRKYRRSDGVVAREMGGSAVLIHLASNRIYELNSTGARIWSMLDLPRRRDEICVQLQQEFAAPVAEV
jgi:hypothetical protein